MSSDPIIETKIKNFKESHSLESLTDDSVLERLVNYTILTSYKTSPSIEQELLDTVSIGGGDDLGLDGICVRLNGNLVSSVEEAKSIFSKSDYIEIEFLFIQSKNKSKFKNDEFLVFTAGVKDILSNEHKLPANDDVKEWIALRDYLFTDDVVNKWDGNPRVTIYYVVAKGEWDDQKCQYIVASAKQFKSDIKSLNSYGDVDVHCIDSKKLKKLFNDNDNKFTETVGIRASFYLPPVDKVGNSCMVLLDGESLAKLLITDEGILRRGLFYDNVRDYQGSTNVNSSISETIKGSPDQFVLVNNGITIICSSFIITNDKIKIENPQVVNGCQTSVTIYNAKKRGADVSKIVVSAKVISTSDSEITGNIIKGTNRQNIVYEEAFECTSPFHKDLEAFYKAKSEQNPTHKVFYERRAKQFAANEIKAFEKTTFRNLIQTFVSLFMNAPHKGHMHEWTLLSFYKNKIFMEKQSKLSYYVAGLLNSVFENYVSKNAEKRRFLRTYKFQVLYLLVNNVTGPAPDINKKKEIEPYCEKIIKLVFDEKFDNTLKETTEKFEEIIKKWIGEKGPNGKYQIKDTLAFTEFMIGTPVTEKEFERGTVVTIKTNQHGNLYGFISRSPSDIYFSSNDNPKLNFKNLKSKDVIYRVKDVEGGLPRAVEVSVVEDS